MRLDLLLVERKLAPSRAQAQALIKAGAVELLRQSQWSVADRVSLEVDPQIEIRLREELKNPYVSRGGLKLAAALERVHLNPQGLRVLDVGISTGGFSDCLLQKGAVAVVGVESGHGQLHARLQSDPRIQCFEKTNARDLPQLNLGGPFDLIVVDVSFISILLLIPGLSSQLHPQGHVLSLIKPQFEVGPEGLNKKGIVRDPAATEAALKRVQECFIAHNFKVKDCFACAIKGGDGNQEYFIYAEKI